MRKIAVVTGTRADYGLIYWLLREIQGDPELKLQVIVTGMHLSPEFGNTYKVIEKDGFEIDWRVDMLLSSDTTKAMSQSVGLGVIGFAEAFNYLEPDIVVLTGDRFETLAAAQAAMFAKIPIAHLYGGEITEGAIDEAIRHSITKMAYVHYTAAEEYRNRVIQLGEHPERVFNYGAPGLDHITRTSTLSRKELAVQLDFSLDKPYFLVTYHPETLGMKDPVLSLDELLSSLDEFPDYKVLITKPNADPGGRALISQLEKYKGANTERVYLHTSLGQLRYLSAMKNAAAVIGNSSSGIIEAPACRVATVNIGDRQKGRLRSDSVIDCKETTESITNAIRIAISPEFQQKLNCVESVYGVGNASGRIKDSLKALNLSHGTIKTFYDLGKV